MKFRNFRDVVAQTMEDTKDRSTKTDYVLCRSLTDPTALTKLIYWGQPSDVLDNLSVTY